MTEVIVEQPRHTWSVTKYKDQYDWLHPLADWLYLLPAEASLPAKESSPFGPYIFEKIAPSFL